jgi:hypothetical protein
MDVRSNGVTQSIVALECAMPIEHPRDVPLGMPSPEALQMASDAMRRHYVLPETMEHPAVRAECLRLAYLIQAYGLASTKPESQNHATEEQRDVGSPRCAPTVPFRNRSPHGRHMIQDSLKRELVEA